MKKWIFLILTALILPQYVSAGCINVLNSCPSDMPAQCNRTLCCETKEECTAKEVEIELINKETKSKQTTTVSSSTTNSALCPDGISVNTALGCLAAGNPTKMVSQLLGWGAIVGAGIAFLMIVFAGIQIVLAGGDPKKVQAARELITSAITGLILIIFSVFLINLIGVDILGLSKLGFGS